MDINMYYVWDDSDLLNRLNVENSYEFKIENPGIEFTNNCNYNEFCSKDDFFKFCETIKDDDFFLKVCEYYDETFTGGLKELNDNPTEKRINDFKECVQLKALSEIDKLWDYYDRASTSDC